MSVLLWQLEVGVVVGGRNNEGCETMWLKFGWAVEDVRCVNTTMTDGAQEEGQPIIEHCDSGE